MKRIRNAAAAALILALASPISGLELSVQALVGNIFFPWDQVTATAGAFPADNIFRGLSVSASDSVGDNLSYSLSYKTDPVLRHLVSVLLIYDLGFARLSAGPFLGAFNSAEAPMKSGLAASLRLEWPGRMFALLRSESSLGGGLMVDGDYIQESTEIAAGWYVRNAICTLSILTKSL
ncbi:MAG TPA: hypothetical protein VLH39_02790, partial [Magnetospirillaceae bacterium]|nr:hypothetical protein [Magnetospirillaceae bacterium]